MIEDPIIAEDPDRLEWHAEADSVVVGFGGAGAVAAIDLRERGLSVIVVDAFGGGGATAHSGAVHYAGGGTRPQKEGGIDDSVEDMFQYLRAEGVPVSDATLRRFCEQSSANIDWLEKHGVRYGSAPYLDKCALPPDGHFLYYSGNEKHPRFSALARPAPRAHRVKTGGFGGPTYFAALKNAALGAGALFMAHSPVRRLVKDRKGRVIGVEILDIPPDIVKKREALDGRVKPWSPASGKGAEKAIAENRALEQRVAKRRLIRARRGVILATGGYIYNLDIVGRTRPEIAASYPTLMRLGKMGCDGSGIELGRTAGGVPDYMERISVGRIIAPPDALLGGILVNDQGKRFINEDVYVCTLGDALADQASQGHRMWLVLSASDLHAAFRQALRPGRKLFMLLGLPTLLNMLIGGTKRASSLSRLAQKCGIDAEQLQQTVDAYNQRISRNEADPLGKNPSYTKKLVGRGWYALNQSFDNLFGFTTAFSLGGLRVDEASSAVVRENGEPIAGLYAVGRAAVGLCSLAYMSSGMAIADTVFSGRRAAQAMSDTEVTEPEQHPGIHNHPLPNT